MKFFNIFLIFFLSISTGQDYALHFNGLDQYVEINAIPEENKVLLEVYDINGRKISTLIDENIQKGYHSIVWNGSDYSSGVYFIRMASGGYVSTNKVVLVK